MNSFRELNRIANWRMNLIYAVPWIMALIGVFARCVLLFFTAMCKPEQQVCLLAMPVNELNIRLNIALAIWLVFTVTVSALIFWVREDLKQIIRARVADRL